MKSIVIGLVLLMAAPAVAETKSEGSEFYYQPAAGQHAITPALSYTSVEFEVFGVSSTTKITNLGAEYLFGLMDNLALGAHLSYTSSDPEGGATAKGLDDIILELRGRLGMAAATLRYGLNLQLSPGDQEVDANGDTSNAYSGQHILSPYIGAELNTGGLILGARLSREVNLSDQTTKDASGVKTKTSGGETTQLDLFVEHHAENLLLGGKFSYGMIEDSKDDSGNTTEALSPSMILTAYGRYMMDESMAFLPSIAYIKADGDISGVDAKLSGLLLIAALRMTL